MQTCGIGIMPSVTKRIWSTSRQIMGNLLPALFSVPIGALGIWMYEPTKPFAPLPLTLIIAFPLVGIVALNWLGLFGNNLLRGELSRLFSRENEIGDRRLIFIGLARPEYKGILDPHQELAFLLIGPEELELYGELTRLKIPRRHVIEIKRKRNIHSWLGLGGWVVLRFVEGATTRELLLEPREFSSLARNRRFAKALFADLEKWRNGAEPEGSAP